MKNYLLTLGTVLFCHCLLLAQSKRVDSLKKILPTIQASPQKVDMLNQMSREVARYDGHYVAIQEKYAQKAKRLAQQINYEKGEAEATWLLGMVSFVKGAYKPGMTYAEKTLKMAKAMEDGVLMAKAYDLKGAIYVYSSKFDLSLKFHQKAFQTYDSLKNKKGMGESAMNIGNVYWHQNKHFESLKPFLQSLNLYKSIDYHHGIAEAFNKVGQAFQSLYNFSQAAKYHLEALKLFEMLKDQREIANTYHKIASIYDTMDENHKALEYLLKALKIFRQMKHESGTVAIMGDISNIYNEIEDYKNAIKYGEAILENNKKTLFPAKKLWIIGNIGLAYGGLKVYEEAIPKVQKAITELSKGNEKHAVAYLSVQLGKLYMAKADYELSEKFLMTGVKLAQEINNTKTFVTGLQGLYELYKLKGKYIQALRFHEQYNAIQDSVLNIRKEKEIASLQLVYRVDKKQLENDQLKQSLINQKKEIQQERLIIFLSWGVVILLMLLVVGLFVVMGRTKNTNLRLKEQQESVLKQNVILQQNEEEIRTKAETIAEQRDNLIKANEENQTQMEQITQQNIQLEEALQKLRELDDFKQKTVGMIAHDLKNPLSSIIGLSETTLDAQKQKVIFHSGKRMLHLIMNMLDVQRFKDTQFKPHMSEQSLDDLANRAINEVIWLIQEKNLKMDHQTLPGIIVEVDADLMVRVLVNLLHNAAKSTPNNGSIGLKYQLLPNEQLVRVIVSDTGAGIPAANLPHVFEENNFLQASASLRLSFCKTVVEGHQGKVGAEAKPEQGGTFWFTLPVLTYVETEGQSSQIGRITSDKKSWKEKLSTQDKYLLAPYLERLKALNVYQLSKVKAVLRQIELSEQTHLQEWKTALEKSLFSANQDLYEELIFC